MAQITVSISDELEQELRKFADKNGYATLSALVSESIRDRIQGNSPSYWQRVQMVIQLRNNQLLETLADGKSLLEGEDWHLSNMHNVLMNGYKIEYPSEFEFINRDELSDDVARSVYDILDMYRDLQSAARKLNDKELAKKLVFPGFDGNNDHIRLGYARHLVMDGRWEDVAVHGSIPNSHGAEPDYKGMVGRHKEMRRHGNNDYHNFRTLTRDEIDYIIG